MIPARTLDAWSDLLATAAARFDALADAAVPGSPAYLDFLTLARRCEDAAGAKAGADVARAAP